LETLARRLEADGPLPTRDAVRLIARLARTVEGLHGAGVPHGRLSALSVLIPGKRLTSARLTRPVAANEAPLMRAPERAADGDPSTADDAWAVALLLYLALTGQKMESLTSARRPLAVFDAGDDALQQLIDTSLQPDPAARLRNLAAFREELEVWLADEGADTGDALPWDEDERAVLKPIDLSALPPPPRAEPSKRGDAPKSKTPPPLPEVRAALDAELTPAFRRTKDEDAEDESRATVAVDEDSRATIPTNIEEVEAALKRKAQARAAQAPRLVPPKIVSEKKRKRKLTPGDTIPLGDDEAPPFPSPESSASEPPPSRASRRTPILAGLALLAVIAGGAYWLTRDPGPALDAPQADASGEATRVSSGHPEEVATGIAEPLRPPPAPSASATPPPVESAAASASTSASASAAPTETLAREEQCVRAALPTDTFESGWVDLSFVCGEADVVKGARRLREAIVLGGSGRGVTSGMKEWSLLGFFELPTYAVVRDRCCPKAGPPVVPASPAICKPTMDDAVFGVMQAARRGEIPAAELAKVDKAARCISRAKQATSFGQHPKPSGGEGTALRTIAGRIAKFLKQPPPP
jgi:eukaryotic-like serine/threonine-protein kinase